MATRMMASPISAEIATCARRSISSNGEAMSMLRSGALRAEQRVRARAEMQDVALRLALDELAARVHPLLGVGLAAERVDRLGVVGRGVVATEETGQAHRDELRLIGPDA